MSDDEDDENDALAGLSRPTLGLAPTDDVSEDEEEGRQAPAGAPIAAAEDDDEDSEVPHAQASFGGVSAEEAFDLQTAPGALELDPFRVASGIEQPPADASSGTVRPGSSGLSGRPVSNKLFVGGLSHATTDDALIKYFAKYGKVQEAIAVPGRGFGFVTFVSAKGAKYCLQQCGDPPSVSIDGRECTIRCAEQKDDRGAGRHKMPARGSVAYLGAPPKKEGSARSGSSAAGLDSSNEPTYGVAAIAAAQKREREPRAPGVAGTSGGAAAGSAPAGSDELGEGEGNGGKRSKKKQEIVTVSRRQDAEPLYDKALTMREIFPKEFWRI
jgi:hypothetical protein